MHSLSLRSHQIVSVVLAMGLLMTVSACSQTLPADVANSPAVVENISKHADVINDLKKGGYIIFFRHGKTEPGNLEEPEFVLDDCSTQRTLSEEGWEQVRAIGRAFTALQIPIGDVFSSEYCRAWQTADLIFGKYKKTSRLSLSLKKGGDETLDEKKERALPLLLQKPAKGTNTILMSHSATFDALTGGKALEPEAAAYILRPNGKTFDLVALITPDEWSQLSW